MKLLLTTLTTILIMVFSLSSISYAASLNQAAWVSGSNNYQYGHRSIPNIKIRNAPADTDWKRWAMLHDGAAYRLYFFKKGSKSKIYQFAFNRAKNVYEYGYNSIPVLTLVGAPRDANFRSFAMLHDGKDYRLYLRQKGNPRVLYQFAWVQGTTTYKFGHRSIPKMNITGFPRDTDWRRWQMLHDGSAYRLYFFKKGSNTQFYQGSFKRSTQSYEYGHNSIPVLNLVGMPANSNTRRAAMLHDGTDYRLYFRTKRRSAGNRQGGGRTRTVEAGPIWNQADAEQKCPRIARQYNAQWTGHWWTTVQGKMSVCQIR